MWTRAFLSKDCQWIGIGLKKQLFANSSTWYVGWKVCSELPLAQNKTDAYKTKWAQIFQPVRVLGSGKTLMLIPISHLVARCINPMQHRMQKAPDWLYKAGALYIQLCNCLKCKADLAVARDPQITEIFVFVFSFHRINTKGTHSRASSEFQPCWSSIPPCLSMGNKTILIYKKK